MKFDRYALSRYTYRAEALLIIAIFMIAMLPVGAFSALDKPSDTGVYKRKGPERTALAAINQMNRVHRRSNIWMNMTNWGYFGNSGENRNDAVDDPCRTGEWAPQCEYPGGSDIQYLFMGALWLGALIRAEGYEYPRVSVGADGWLSPSINEFWPGEGEYLSQENGIIERPVLNIDYDCLGNPIRAFQDSAVSEQDFVCTYSDTLTESFFVRDDPIDGPHFPLGIKVTQKSYAWTYNYAQNFLLIDWEIENIAGNYLKNLYVGLYVDADVGMKGNTERHTDDICGFQRMYYYERPDGVRDSSTINTAYIVDNDGRENTVASGADFEAPGVTGVRVVRAPNPKLRTSFNWWISNGDADRDFGPSWQDDNAPASWTETYGTPMGDEKKYFVLSNREFDYDQVKVDDTDELTNDPFVITDPWDPEKVLETHYWKVPGEEGTPANLIGDLADGFDTRYLLSWGPLGIFDHMNEAGERVYRLNPGEKFSMTIAYVAGDNFHDRNKPQPNNEDINEELFNFSSLRYNADWAARVYDNPMIDTPIYDWGNDHDPAIVDDDGSQGDGIMDTGDGWYGEDVGTDGLYAVTPGDICYRWVGGVRIETIYPGPDPDGTENDGHLQRSEDELERPEYIDWMMENGMLDFGDGHPDFQGPPPPPSPVLSVVKEPITVRVSPDSSFVISDEFLEENVVLSWRQNPSEDPNYKDPFSREMDFEGYRVYVSNNNLEKDFALLDEFDKVDWALYSERDSLASRPREVESDVPADSSIVGIYLIRREVGENLGFFGHYNLIKDTLSDPVNPYYYYLVHDANPLVPRYYSVTAYDYGDYKTGTQPLESAKIANSIYIAPSGNQKKAVGVVPNPYRANADYTQSHGGVSWENRADGTSEFFPQTDRRLYFYNLPKHCLIRIYTVAGDLVDIVPHNLSGDDNLGWVDDYAEYWDLNSRNHQQVVSGMYLFTVEEFDENEKSTGDLDVGKFVVIR